MDSLLDDMVAAGRSWSAPLLNQWYSETEQEARRRAALAHQAERVGDEEFGKLFRNHLRSVPVDDPLAWANRRLELPDGHWCVAGIRFRGLDISRPFVDIVATSLPPTIDALCVIAATVVPAYTAFAPRAIRLMAPDPDALVAAATADPRMGSASIDQYVIAGLVSALREHRRAAAFADVSLARVEPRAAARRVTQLYAQLAVEQPHLALWATPATVDELQQCDDEHLLFEVNTGGQPAGFVAARRSDSHGVSGFVVTELVLDRAHRGRGLASAVLQRLLAELPAHAGDTLWGTIHPDNQPSLRNARSIGRDIVGGYVWLVPAGLPGV